VSAADAREELEAEVWRVLGVYSKHPLVHLVDGILSRAEAYTSAYAAEAVEHATAAEASAAEHREQPTGTVPPAPRCACGAILPDHPGRGPKPRKCPACRAEGLRAYRLAWSRSRRRRQKANARRCPDCGAPRPDHLITCGILAGTLGRPA